MNRFLCIASVVLVTTYWGRAAEEPPWTKNLPAWTAIPDKEIGCALSWEVSITRDGKDDAAPRILTFTAKGDLTRSGARSYKAAGDAMLVFTRADKGGNYVYTCDWTIKGELDARNPVRVVIRSPVNDDDGKLKAADVRVLAACSNIMSFQEGTEARRFVLVTYGYSAEAPGIQQQDKCAYANPKAVLWPFERAFLSKLNRTPNQQEGPSGELPFLLLRLIDLEERKILDLSTPKAAALSFINALADRDEARAKQASVDNAATAQTIDAYLTYERACEKFNVAMMKRWGDESRQFMSHGMPFNEMTDRFRDGTVKIDGDTAHVAGRRTDAFFHLQEMSLRKVEGKWKVDLGATDMTGIWPMGSANPLKPVGVAIEKIAGEVGAGKYETAAEAARASEDAFRDTLKDIADAAAEKAMARVVIPGLESKNPQERAIARIQLLQGDVEFEETQSGRQAAKITLNFSRASDADLVLLRNLSDVRELHLNETRVTDAGLAHIKGLTRLRTLHLNRTKVTDAGVQQLTALTGLQELGLSGTKITDAGLKSIKELRNLRGLFLADTKITDAGLDNLKELTSLEELYCTNCRGITDAGLQHIKGLEELQRLDLSHTQVTDAGLEHLKGLRKMKQLWLGDTKVTPAGAQKLKQELPDLDIPTGAF